MAILLKHAKTAEKIMEEYNDYKKFNRDFMAIADILSDGMYIIDKDGIIIDANKRYQEIAGLERDELIGVDMRDVWDEKIYHPEEAYIELMHNKMPSMAEVSKLGSRKIKDKKLKNKKPKAIGLIVLEEKKVISVITRIERKNRTVIMTGIPYFNDKGEIEYVATVVRDVSELIRLKGELESFESDKEVYLSELNYLRNSQVDTDLVGSAAAIEGIRELIYQVSKTDVTVLITGETGSGKEVVAREIYKNSLRKNGPYIKVNCAAIPGQLLESELFGYEKGAFTGAQNKDKPGLFQMANRGTILLDEIGEMPMALQSKLLRVLQEKELTRVGGTSPLKVDVRVIAATNQDLQRQIENGTFRKDLFYRLNVFPIKVPPLRERKEDIPVLANHFLEKDNKKYNRHKRFDSEAIEEMESYSWPGNIRELENIIERLVVVGEADVITGREIAVALGRDIMLEGIMKDRKMTLKEAVNMFEKSIIEKALREYGSTYKAAEALGIDQSTVVKKAKALGIKR